MENKFYKLYINVGTFSDTNEKEDNYKTFVFNGDYICQHIDIHNSEDLIYDSFDAYLLDSGCILIYVDKHCPSEGILDISYFMIVDTVDNLELAGIPEQLIANFRERLANLKVGIKH